MLIDLAERRLLPDWMVRVGIRRLLAGRLADERRSAALGDRQARLQQLFATGPMAVETDAANEQHYEVPAEFFLRMLGPHLKYSGCWWSEDCQTLADAEVAMLRLTCQRAECADGQRILELGCGWGSLTLWMAQQYPQARIVAVSNSQSQRELILQRCDERQLTNVEVRVHNVAELVLQEQFDRVVSVEMFEHMRNWQQLLTNIADWLVDDGKLFLHTFCHRELFYSFAVTGRTDWMAEHFFSGGVMPSYDLVSQLDTPFSVQQQWQVEGMHYAKTCRSWLQNLDDASEEIMGLFAADLGDAGARRQLARWRMFVMACEELFAYANGREWFVSHTRLQRS